MLLNIPQPNILLVVSFNFSPCSQTSLVSPLLGGGCGATRARQVPRQLPVTTSGSGPLTLETQPCIPPPALPLDTPVSEV